jgi:hypothetical protein
MKEVVGLLNEAYHALAIDHEDAVALDFINKAIKELKTPRWYTTKQWCNARGGGMA